MTNKILCPICENIMYAQKSVCNACQEHKDKIEEAKRLIKRNEAFGNPEDLRS